jgi:hypothetical protein
MHDAARRVRALLTVGIVILAGFSVSTFGGQFVPVQSGPPPSPQSTPEPAKGTGILIGQVVDAVDGRRGIGGALVSITGTGASQSQVVLPNGEVIFAGGPIQASGPNDPPRQVLTDSGGRFMFRNLAAGRYSIRATASPYLGGAYGATRAGGGGQTVELSRDDEKRDGLVIKMWKGATISGTVVDEAGEPAIGVPIKYIRRTVSGGRTRLVALSSEATDDRGAYRIADLTPGDYFVGVVSSSTTMPVSTADAMTQARYSGASITTSEVYRELMTSTTSVMPLLLGGSGGYRVGDFMFQQSGYLGGGTFNAPAPGQDGRVLAYPSTFYPGVGVIAQATPITVASGEDRMRIDLQLKLLPSMRVSGVVIGPDGPLRNLGLRLLPSGADEFTSDTQIEAASSVTDANGAFTFLGVTPGAYTLKSLRIPRPAPVAVSRGASSGIEVTGPGGVSISMSSSAPMTMPPPPPLPTEPTLWASMAVSVNDRDVSGLVVTLRGGAKLSGRIVFEGNAEKPTPDQVQQTSIALSPVGASPSVAAVAKRVEPDGTFGTNGYPAGRYLVGASAPSSVSGKWKFKSATQGGRIVSDEGLDLQGADAGGLVITFTDQLGEISGSVQNDRGTPDQTGSVVLLPADSTAWKEGVINARRLRNARLTTTGSFTFGDVPPGAYFVAAIAGDLPENWQLAATLETISRLGTRVVVADGAKVSQSLTSRSIR